MVETAFEGTVTAIDPEAPGALGDTLQMVTFDVTQWYTNDYGTTFSIWAPNFAGAVGEPWLIAGALYATLGQQSGESFPVSQHRALMLRWTPGPAALAHLSRRGLVSPKARPTRP